MWYEPSTQRVFETHSDIRLSRPDVSLPLVLTDEVIASLDMLPMVDADKPAETKYVDRCEFDTVVVSDGVATRTWKLIPLTPDEIAADKVKMVAECDSALTAHLDAVAQSRRYDNRITCALRAGYVGPFQTEGQAFAAWMDTCNAMAYQFLAEVQSGTRPWPTNTTELIAALPPMVWPS